MYLLRVITWNIACGAEGYHACNVDKISETLALLKPDIVLLQEVDCLVSRSGNRDIANDISKKLGSEWRSHFAPALSKGAGSYGNAILSRFPMTSCQSINLGPGTSDADWELQNRSAACALIQCEDLCVLAVSTHLASNAARPSLVREAQIKKLLSEIGKLSANDHLIGGDFNTYRNSPDLEMLNKDYRSTDVGPTCSLVDGPEYLVWDIDRIYVRGQMQITTAKRFISATASDHALVLADFMKSS